MSQLGIFVDASGVVKSLAGDAGSATPTALGVITIAGGNNIGTSGALNTLTINLDGTTNHAIQLGNVSGSLSSLAVGATGTVLTGVTGADPAFSASPTVTTIYAGTFDTNVAAAGVTLSGTTLSADGTDVDININITAKGAGKVIIDDLQLTTDLAVTEGGTGVSTLTDHGLLVGSGAAAIDALSVGATGTILTGVTGADPTWTTATYPSTVTKGGVLVALANNVVGVVNDVVNAGYVLTANAAAAPTFQPLPAGVTFASDAETIAGAVTNKAVAPSNLAAKLGSQTLHALPIGAGSTAALNWLAVGATGETLMGSTGADCGWTNSPQFGGSVTALNDITSTAGSISSLSGSVISRDATNTSTGPSAYFQKVRVAATIQSGDELGKMRFTGYDGTGYITGAKITSTNSGTVATNRIAGDLKFYTHPDSVVALPSEPTLRMTIASTGAITIASPDSGVGLTVSGGGITCSSGTISASSGAVSASTTVTAGTDLVSTAGVLKLPATSSTVGQIRINNNTVFHTYGGDGSAAQSNLFIGRGAGNYTNSTVYGAGIGIGAGALASCVYAGENFAMGYNCLTLFTGTLNSGGRNVAIGNYSLDRLVGGNDIAYNGAYNIAIGYASGHNYTGNEYSNICLNSPGVLGEHNVLRIGNGSSSSAGSQGLAAAYIGGIYGVTPGGTLNIALINSNGQLGSTATLSQSYLTNGLTWNNSTSTPITAAVNNEYTINTASGLTTINLPATFAVNDRIKIVGSGVDGWTLVAAGGDTIQFGSTPTSSGGSLSSTVRYDSVEIVGIVANTTWNVIGVVGTLTVA